MGCFYITEKWTDLSFEGKAIRRNFRFLDTTINKLCKQKDPDIDKILRLMEGLSRIAVRQIKLIEFVYLIPRLQYIEKLLDHIPSDVIAEAKARMEKQKH